MNKEAIELYIKSEIDRFFSKIPEPTQKAVQDAIDGFYEASQSANEKKQYDEIYEKTRKALYSSKLPVFENPPPPPLKI